MKQNLWCNNNYRYMIQSDGFGKRLSMSQFIFQTSDFTFVRCVQINVENISIDLGSVQVREMQRANRKPGHSTHIPFQPLGNVICLFCKQRLIRLKKRKKKRHLISSMSWSLQCFCISWISEPLQQCQKQKGRMCA